MAGETTTRFSGAVSTSKSAGQPVFQFNQYEVLTSELELNDIMKVGEIPANALVHQIILKTDDLDSGSEALVWELLIGTTSYKAGITNAVAFAGTVAVGEPIITTAAANVNLKAATAATTGAAGTISVTICYTTTN